jgi:hypothetical protein
MGKTLDMGKVSRGSGRKMRLGLSILGASSVLLSASPSTASSAECPPPATIDYLAPFQKFPKVRELPRSGHPSFAPKDLLVRSLTPLLAGGGSAGVHVEADGSSVKHQLEWNVEIAVRRLNAAGHPKKLVAQRTFSLWRNRSFSRDPANLQVPVTKRPGLYMGEFKFAHGGHVLGTFGQYLRVVPRRRDVRLLIGQATYLPGESVVTRMVNRGTLPVAFAPGLVLESWSNEMWLEVNGPTYFGGPASLLSAGASGQCEHLPLPSDLRPGPYRVTKSVDGRKPAVLRAYFQTP